MIYNVYRKKPISIRAISFQGEAPYIGAYNDCPHWFQKLLNEGDVWFDPHSDKWHVKSLEGEMEGDLNCYIVQGIKGEVYICDGEIFEESYEQVL